MKRRSMNNSLVATLLAGALAPSFVLAQTAPPVITVRDVPVDLDQVEGSISIFEDDGGHEPNIVNLQELGNSNTEVKTWQIGGQFISFSIQGDNKVKIEQKGSGRNQVTGIGASEPTVADQANFGNELVVKQDGENTVRFEQRGFNQKLDTTQIGRNTILSSQRGVSEGLIEAEQVGADQFFGISQGGVGNQAKIRQEGSNNNIRDSSENALNQNEDRGLQEGFDNRIEFSQLGNGNNIGFAQSGRGNSLTVDQNGSSHKSNVRQSASTSQWTVTQQGVSQEVVGLQAGSDQTLAITQADDGNLVQGVTPSAATLGATIPSALQTGQSNSATLLQDGKNNEIALSQAGANNALDAIQESGAALSFIENQQLGSGGVARITQRGVDRSSAKNIDRGAANEITILQTAVFSDATVESSGVGAISEISQIGFGQDAKITREGIANGKKVAITQGGRDNEATVNTKADSAVTILQTSLDDRTVVNDFGSSNNTTIVQQDGELQGGVNNATVTLESSSGTVELLQQGRSGEIVLTHGRGANGASSTIHQVAGFGNSAVVSLNHELDFYGQQKGNNNRINFAPLAGAPDQQVYQNGDNHTFCRNASGSC